LTTLPEENCQLDGNMGKKGYCPLERIELLRLVVYYFELTSEGAADPQAHVKLLAAFRNQLAQLEIEEPAPCEASSPFERLFSFMFGKA